MQSRMSEKGQVTIPKPLRKSLGLRTGQVLEFHERDGRIVVEKAHAGDQFDAARGVISLGGRTTDGFVEELRGPLVDG